MEMVCRMNFDTIFRSPKRYLLISTLIAVIAVLGVQFVKLSTDIRDNFDRENVDLLAFTELEDTYGSTTTATFLLQQPVSSFDKDILLRLNSYTELAERLPFSIQVNSLATSLVIEAESDLITISTINDLLVEGRVPLDDIRDYALRDRSLIRGVLSKDETVSAIHVLFEFDRNNDKSRAEIVNALQVMKTEITSFSSGQRVYLTGSIVIDAARKEATQRNLSFLVPLMYFLTVVFLGALYRSFPLVLITVSIAMLTVAEMLGVAGYVGITLSSNSMSSISVMTGIVIAAVSHLLVQMSQRVDSLGYPEAVKEGVRLNIKPIVLTGVTTFIAFISMNMSELPPLRDLGNLVAIGIFFSLMNCLILLPCILLTVKVTIKDFSAWQVKWFRGYGAWLLKHPKEYFGVIVIISISLVLCSQFNQVRDNFAHYYDESFDFRVANDFADKHLSGLYTLEYSFESLGSGGVTSAKYLADLDRLGEWLKQNDKVRHVSSLVDIIKLMNRTMHDNDERYYKVPTDSALASQFLLVYELSLPNSHSLTQMVNLSKTSSRLVVTVPSMPSDELLALESEISQWLTINTDQFKFHSVTGLSYVFAKVFKTATITSMQSAAIALFLIAGLLIFALKSFPLGILSLVPNMLPFFFAFGIWGVIDGSLIAATTAVVVITLGIVVDDTIHFLHKVQYFVEGGAETEEAIIRTMEEVGPAMVISTLSIGLGFLVLAFSAFLPTIHFGALASLVLFAALLLDLSLLPLLLYFARNRLFNRV